MCTVEQVNTVKTKTRQHRTVAATSSEANMLRSPKAQGLSINVIILIVLGLVVLLVLFLIFNKYARNGTDTIDQSCTKGGNTCVTNMNQCASGMPGIGVCPKAGGETQICCKIESTG